MFGHTDRDTHNNTTTTNTNNTTNKSNSWPQVDKIIP
jgi:hypothetical protein